MASEWFYSHNGEMFGPCSEQNLRDMAASGGLIATDTIWKENIACAVTASRIKSLFPGTQGGTATRSASAASDDTELLELAANSPLLEAEAEPDAEAVEVATEMDAAARPADKTAAAKEPDQPKPVKKGRATAVRGVVIVGQDGEMVRFKKKCEKCGQLAGSANKMPIKSGVIRTNYFCPKCRKTGEVVIQCMR